MADYDVYPNKFGPHVRVVCRKAAPPSSDYAVQVRRKDATAFFGWAFVDVAKFNDMSDDYALTNAHNRALTERAKIVEGEA